MAPVTRSRLRSRWPILDILPSLGLHLRNRQATRPDGAPHEGILLYPQVGEEPLTAEIRLEGFRIQARTVNLDQDWRLIQNEMLGTIGCAGT